jgi:CBS domain-containing protein
MACIEKRVVRNVISLEASASCAEAARAMAKHGIGSVGVCRGGRIVGLVTERDLVAAVMGRLDPDRTSLGEVMPADRPTVSPFADEHECAQLMRRGHTRHLAVKDGDEIVGVVSMLDLVELVVEENEWRIDQLESYIGGGRAHQLSEPIGAVFER